MDMPRNPRFKNRIGDRYGRLKVVAYAGPRGRRNHSWTCLCDCGGTTTAAGSNLQSGGTRSCGCLQRERRADRVGDRYGRLEVIAYGGPLPGGHHSWVCRCDCGAETSARSDSLTSGDAKSCGCLRKETTKRNKTKHGHAERESRTPEYQAWSQMKRRCYSPSSPRYATYGGRGIQVCDRWRDDFSAFLEDMGFRPTTKHSLGRIDNDGDYGPDNCRWELPEQQANNTTRNTHITIADQTKSVAQWARKHGVDPNLAQARIHNLGWSVEDACTLPAQRPGPKPRPKPPCAVCGVPCKTVQAHTCSKKCAWTLRRRRS